MLREGFFCKAASSRTVWPEVSSRGIGPVMEPGGPDGGCTIGKGTQLPLSPLSGKPNFSRPVLVVGVLAHGRVICRRRHGSSTLPDSSSGHK